MSILGDELPIKSLYKARYDRLYASKVLTTSAVMDFTADKSCPNGIEPSDHLPIAAFFTMT